MKSIRSALLSRPKRTLGLAILIVALGFVAPVQAGGGNMVSVFRTADGDCWFDANPDGSPWTPQGAGNDANEEVAAGKATTGFGKFVGVRPEDVAQRHYPSCGGVWTPG